MGQSLFTHQTERLRRPAPRSITRLQIPFDRIIKAVEVVTTNKSRIRRKSPRLSRATTRASLEQDSTLTSNGRENSHLHIIVKNTDVLQSTVPQVVLFGDSLFQQCSDLQEGFSFQAALQSGENLS